MLNVENRAPYPGKEGRVKLTQDNGQVIEGVLEMADDATVLGTPWSRQSGRLLQADIRTYPIATGQTITQGDVVDVVDGSITQTPAPQPNVETVIGSYNTSFTKVFSIGNNRAVCFFITGTYYYVYILNTETSPISVVNYTQQNFRFSYSSAFVVKLTDESFAIGINFTGSAYVSMHPITISGNSIQIGNEATPSQNNTSSSMDSTALSDNSFINFYSDNGLYARVCTISSSDITSGSNYMLSGVSSASYISATRLSDSGTTRRVCVCYADGGNSNAGTAVIVSIDASNNVTFGSPVVFASDAAGAITSDGTDNTVFALYVTTVSSNYGNKITELNISGNSIIVGNTAIVNGTTNNNTPAIVSLSENSAVCFYSTSGSGTSGTATIATKTSSSFNMSQNFQYNSGRADYPSASLIDSSQLVLAYADFSSSNYGTATILTVSGNQIAGSFLDESKDAIALQSGTAGQSIEVIYSGTVYADWVTAGQVISSPGVYGVGVLDGVLQVWSAERPGVQIETGSYTGTGTTGAAGGTIGYNSLTFTRPVEYLVITAQKGSSSANPQYYVQTNYGNTTIIPVIQSALLSEKYTAGTGPIATYAGTSVFNSYAKISEDKCTISWYISSGGADEQFNASNTTYYYIAFCNG